MRTQSHSDGNVAVIIAVALLIALARCSDPPWPVDRCPPTHGTCRETAHRCDRICRGGRCEIKVGVILTNDTRFLSNIRTAERELARASQRIREERLLPANVHLALTTYDDRCESAYGLLGVLDGYAECVHVYIGPVCDYVLASAGRLVQYVGSNGIPLITPGGFVFDFTKRKTRCGDEFFMVVNSGQLDYRSLAEFFKHFVDAYKWNKIAFMYNQFDQNEVGGVQSCKLLMNSIIEEIKAGKLEYNDGDLHLLNVTYAEYFRREIGAKYGIITICASHAHTRDILLAADALNMIDTGEYLFFNFEPYNNAPVPSRPWYDPNDTERTNERARRAFTRLYTFAPWKEARFAVDNRRTLPPPDGAARGAIYADGLYDSLLIYAHALNRTLRVNGDDGDADDDQVVYGSDVMNHIRGLRFRDKHGDETVINCNGQRVAQYALLQLDGDATHVEIVARYDLIDKNVTFLRQIRWPHGAPRPSDTPVCGYDMSKCPPSSHADTVAIVVSVVMVTAIVAFVFMLYRHYKLEAAIASMTWKVSFEEIAFCGSKKGSLLSLTTSKRGSTTTLSEMYSLAGDRQIFTDIAYYKGTRVAVKAIAETKIELTREQLLELKAMKDLANDHVVKFYGACLDVPHCYVLTEYCPRGSLQDILENDRVVLDRVFRLSLIRDIVSGMRYLHGSEIRSHGSLRSSNCVVDGRFVLKVSDFGLHFLRKRDDPRNEADAHAYWQKLLWTAPELLRMQRPPKAGTQKGDVYSFAIIVHEIETRQGVFYLGANRASPREIVDGVRNGPEGNHGQPLRPYVEENSAAAEDEVTALMRRCWAEEAQDRPDFNVLKNTIRKLNKEYDNGNILDNLLSRMEQYANNLEALVEERTADYLQEKQKCEDLLYQLLPKSVARQLITGESVIAETFDQVTIYFSDIVGFTALSAQSTPLQVVDLLNDLYTCFDSIIENFGVYKVETIGDAYMVVSGLPVRNENRHAAEIARMSLALRAAVRRFAIRHRPGEPLRLRIGMHSGPCVAGVVGLKMPRYCLFGDTVNTASRMESTGEPFRIHVSPATKRVLDDFGTFDLERRGEIEIKGKGKMVTYWLNGERAAAEGAHAATTTTTTTDRGRAMSNASSKRNIVRILGSSERAVDDDAATAADVPLLSVTAVNETRSERRD